MKKKTALLIIIVAAALLILACALILIIDLTNKNSENNNSILGDETSNTNQDPDTAKRIVYFSAEEIENFTSTSISDTDAVYTKFTNKDTWIAAEENASNALGIALAVTANPDQTKGIIRSVAEGKRLKIVIINTDGEIQVNLDSE